MKNEERGKRIRRCDSKPGGNEKFDVISHTVTSRHKGGVFTHRHQPPGPTASRFWSWRQCFSNIDVLCSLIINRTMHTKRETSNTSYATIKWSIPEESVCRSGAHGFLASLETHCYMTRSFLTPFFAIKTTWLWYYEL